MVESTALEMRRGRKPTVGSNPTLSASFVLAYPPERLRSKLASLQSRATELMEGAGAE